jgi:hypothetical protein
MQFFTRDGVLLFETPIVSDVTKMIVPADTGEYLFSRMDGHFFCSVELTEIEVKGLKKRYGPLQWKQQDYFANIEKKMIGPLEDIKKALIAERTKLLEEKKNCR